MKVSYRAIRHKSEMRSKAKWGVVIFGVIQGLRASTNTSFLSFLVWGSQAKLISKHAYRNQCHSVLIDSNLPIGMKPVLMCNLMNVFILAFKTVS